MLLLDLPLPTAYCSNKNPYTPEVKKDQVIPRKSCLLGRRDTSPKNEWLLGLTNYLSFFLGDPFFIEVKKDLFCMVQGFFIRFFI